MTRSEELFERAKAVIPGGVSSPVRAFKAVGGTPLFVARAKGARFWDEDGRSFVDYVGSWGPMILGHAHPAVLQAIRDAASRGTSFGAPCALEVELAERVVRHVPSVEKVRFVSSGTEATMSALRVASGFTGRRKILKFDGGYHGHADSLLVSAGSGATTLGVPSSPGVPKGATADTILAPYNDLSAVEKAMAGWHGQVAAVLVEPVAGNMGVVPPAEGFLAGLRTLCDKHGSLLIFDEVMTGFRVSYGGAQGLYGVRPDISVLGKVIGGGLPVGAVAAPAAVMKHLAPEGPVYQAGTLSGNPVAMAAGLATLQSLQAEGFYDRLEATSAALEQALRQAARAAGLDGKVHINRVGSMMTCFFTPGPVVDYASATAANTRAFAAWFQEMLAAGVYLPPSQFEAFFVSAAHAQADVEKTAVAAEKAFAAAAKLL